MRMKLGQALRKGWHLVSEATDRVLIAMDQFIKDPRRLVSEWEDQIGPISSGHTQVTGMLAGFSATIVVLIIGLHFGGSINLRGNSGGEVSLGIFAMAFFGYVATGILYSISVERMGIHRRFLFSTASILYYFSGILSFAALYPLIRLIQSEALQQGVFIMVVGGLCGGYLAAAIPLYDLLLVKRRYLIGVLGGSICVGIAAYFLLTGKFEVKSTTLVFWLLIGCALVVVTAFNLVAVTFFIAALNRSDFYRLSSLVLIALATLTLCFAIGLGVSTKGIALPPERPQMIRYQLPSL